MGIYNKDAYRVAIEYHENGTMKSLAVVLKKDDSTEVRDGLFLEWYDGGALKHVKEYRYGQLDGINASLSPGGMLLGEVECVNDEPHGRMLYFSPDGTCYYSGSFPEQVPEWWGPTELPPTNDGK